MSKTGGNVFEEHVEKIVLTIIGLVCVWLLFMHVLISPNYVQYDNKKYSSDSIDDYIFEQTRFLEDKLNEKPQSKEAYAARIDKFNDLMDTYLSGIDVSIYTPIPNLVSKDQMVKSKYRLPGIGQVTDVAVEHIRAVAYIPIGQIDEENTYESAEHEVNDIDLVTVEAKFDVADLYERFYESFAGDEVPEDWHDPCLAKFVFAAVDLQRQQLVEDGTWSDWQRVPRLRIDPHQKMFEIIEDVKELPTGGMKVRLLQFDDLEVRMDLLQPLTYNIASDEEDWFPPLLHKKFLDYEKQVKDEEKRDKREADKEARDRDLEIARKKRANRKTKTKTRKSTGKSMGPGMMMPGGGGFGLSTKNKKNKTSRSEERKERKLRERSKEQSKEEKGKLEETGDFYGELDKISITETTVFDKTSEPVTLWAHDDTVESGKTYRYRIRLGVFNPIAGTNQFETEYEKMKDKVVLWSDFAQVPESVEIPETLYFFPFETPGVTDTVRVQISRYVLGYWYSKDFSVKPGEIIGKVDDYQPSEEEEKNDVTVPEQVDYSTDTILVDVTTVNDWVGTSNIRPRYYSNMLYSVDDRTIEHMPIRLRYWPTPLQVKFNEIKKAMKEPKKPLRKFGGKFSRRRSRQRSRPGPGGLTPGMGPGGMMPWMMPQPPQR